MKLKFVVPGEPKGKARPRVTQNGCAYTPKETVQYENLVKMEYHRQCGRSRFNDDAPLDVRIAAYYSIPKSVSKKKKQLMRDRQLRPMKKPDTDNVVKIVLDSLNGIAYHDDVQVVDCQVRKFYSDEPRVVVIIQNARQPNFLE